MAALLEVQNLSHSYEHNLFSDINLTLNPKDSISIMGISGSGKSTLLHICATLLRPDGGTVKLMGKDLYSKTSKEILKTRREDVGIIFQSHYLFKGFNAYENIELATLLNNTKIDEELIEKLGIQQVLKQSVGELSGGQQQRVSIARVLSKKPKIIFADEPTGNLDSKTASEVMDILFEYIDTNNAGLLLVTHDSALANRTNIKCNL